MGKNFAPRGIFGQTAGKGVLLTLLIGSYHFHN